MIIIHREKHTITNVPSLESNQLFIHAFENIIV